MDIKALQLMAYQSILDMTTEDGINASGRDEVFGCIFGRDSAITIIKILKSISRCRDMEFIDTVQLQSICKQTLETLSLIQGKHINIESGEEPGKFVHEYRKDNYDRLLTAFTKPWYVYPDKKVRNYDSIDATPLVLLAFHTYWETTKDSQFICEHESSIKLGLQWLMTYGDKDSDGLIEYELSTKRTHGGLCVQSWTDSTESLLQADGTFPHYPIAPVEAQGYTWLAFKVWADYFQTTDASFSHQLTRQANKLKRVFNQKFLMMDQGKYYPVQALDGNKRQIKTVTGNPLLLLWASYQVEGKIESILDNIYVHNLVSRAFEPDMFDPEAGIRTMSTLSPTYMPNNDSYHNGSFWPKLNGMAHGGLLTWGFTAQAEKLKRATLIPIDHFQTPIELYIKNNQGELLEFKAPSGQTGCRQQAWTAAVMLNLTAASN